MSDSLRDQLVKSGLAREQDARRAKSEKRQGRRGKGKGGGADAGGGEPQSEAARLAAQREADKRARDRTLNRRREEERRRQADEHAARELVIAREVPHDGEVAFNFQHGERIRKLHVSEAQRRDLAAGRLAIARTRGRYRLIPGEIVDKIRARAPFLIAWTASDAAAGEVEDPAYADFPVPDDLMW